MRFRSKVTLCRVPYRVGFLCERTCSSQLVATFTARPTVETRRGMKTLKKELRFKGGTVPDKKLPAEDRENA